MRSLIFGLVSFVVTTAFAATAQQTDPPPGKAPFTRVCAQCHGTDANGGQGPRLANIAVEFDEFMAKVRHSGGEMPSFSKEEISDEEVQQVFEFLKSLP